MLDAAQAAAAAHLCSRRRHRRVRVRRYQPHIVRHDGTGRFGSGQRSNLRHTFHRGGIISAHTRHPPSDAPQKLSTAAAAAAAAHGGGDDIIRSSPHQRSFQPLPAHDSPKDGTVLGCASGRCGGDVTAGAVVATPAAPSAAALCFCRLHQPDHDPLGGVRGRAAELRLRNPTPGHRAQRTQT
jgi:hypothetical protein